MRQRNPNLDGYVFLTPDEERQAARFWRDHDGLGDLEDGAEIGDEVIAYGADESPQTGAITVPISHDDAEREAARARMAREARRHADRIERSMIRLGIAPRKWSRLTPRETQELDLWLDGYTQRHIACILKVGQTRVVELLNFAMRKTGIKK